MNLEEQESVLTNSSSSLCPLNASRPITVYGSFALDPLQTASIPAIALQIPDFDGFVSLQIFANSTIDEIGCFQAAMTNGNSLGIPEILAPTIAFFVAIAMISSFATASYGISVPLMRAHYAHSLSVILVIETLQTIFFTGALSLHWPSVLVAWWSNFAWAAGLINIAPLVVQIGTFSGVAGNASQVGHAGNMFANNGGGRLAAQIYGTGGSGSGGVVERDILADSSSRPASAILDGAYNLVRRKLYNGSDPYDYTWGGDPVVPGVPLPGTWQSFSGTISALDIPGASAFTLCLFWVTLAVVFFAASLCAVKGLFELFAQLGWVRQDCMAYYRAHYRTYVLQGALRVLFIAFLPVMTLAIFQFTLHSSPGTTALAAILLAFFLAGFAFATAQATRACPSVKRRHAGATRPYRTPGSRFLAFEKVAIRGRHTIYTKGKHSRRSRPGSDDEKVVLPGVHQDDGYIKRHGWLLARYKSDRWWFFVVAIVLQFARACILGGGADNDSNIDTSDGNVYSSGPPTTQLVILLIFEAVALAIHAYYRPFESSRNIALGVWILGLGRVLVVALCAGLLPQTGLSRIGATAIGFVIIMIQVLMLAAMLVLVAMSVVSTWLSLSRNQDDFHSEMFFSLRKRYLETLLASATGAPPPPTRRQQRKQEKATRQAEIESLRIAASLPPPEPSFSVLDVRRSSKIEDAHNDESDSDIEEYGMNGFGHMHLRRDIEAGLNSGSGSGSGSGSSDSRSSSANGDGTSTRDTNAFATITEDDNESDKDTLGDLGTVAGQGKRRRADSDGFGGVASRNGSSASLVGTQIYDPARVVARMNRSRTASAASLRSVPSASGSIRRVSEMSALSALSGPPQIGILSGRRSASPFGGRSLTPFEGQMVAFDLPHGSASVPLVPRPDSTPPSGRTTPSTAGPGVQRMTPSKETLQRYASERQSLQSIQSLQSLRGALN